MSSRTSSNKEKLQNKQSKTIFSRIFLEYKIHFTNDEVYKNGNVTESSRPTMKMDLQSFKYGNIQLLDLETQQTFLYEKE
ncbi:DUF3994 domain-containing protein [Bacillus sp. JJ1533]|uniref:DUF3994 domain-containing protein n=1 Tax=Bacillus sp. JJ1533 TaxID=3122959 RepID=UPI003F68A840